MAIYCANCGSQVKSGGKFCQACGTPATQSSEPMEAATMRMPSPSQPPLRPEAALSAAAPYAQAPPSPRKSSGALKIVLIVLVVIVALTVVSGIAGIFFLKRAVKQINIGSNGEAGYSINVPGANLSISANSKLTEEQLGVPIYPGAKSAEGTGAISFSTDNGKSAFVGSAVFTTDDSVKKVAEFYQDKLSGKATVINTDNNGKPTVIIKMKDAHVLKTIIISGDDNGTTKIAIANVSNKSGE